MQAFGINLLHLAPSQYSFLYSPLLFIQAFGISGGRKAPAHMPHFIDTNILLAMHQQWFVLLFLNFVTLSFSFSPSRSLCVSLLLSFFSLSFFLSFFLSLSFLLSSSFPLPNFSFFRPAQFEKTSSNKLRSSDNMQFSFSYFYFYMNQRKEFNFDDVWDNEFDKDHDG